MFNQDSLNQSLSEAALPQDEALFEDLRAAYSGSDRHCHNQTHVEACLIQFQKYRGLALYPHEVELAIWFHDAIYYSRRGDNEARSAEWARDYLRICGADSQMIDRVVKMILATKTHQVTSPDSALLVDVDLGILGSTPETFEQYDQSIRKEYHWVAEEEYRLGRLKVLRSFYDREKIYHTIDIRKELERPARRNLSRKIAQLEGG